MHYSALALWLRSMRLVGRPALAGPRLRDWVVRRQRRRRGIFVELRPK